MYQLRIRAIIKQVYVLISKVGRVSLRVLHLLKKSSESPTVMCNLVPWVVS